MSVIPLREIFHLKSVLSEIEPVIWRRFAVVSDINLVKFHEVVQIIMGWTNSHLHQFTAKGKTYEIPDEAFLNPNFENENNFKLNKILNTLGDSIIYEYDFGDTWIHQISLEKKNTL